MALSAEAVKKLYKRAEILFEKKGPVNSLWAELARHFYPERNDFTTVRNLGQEVGTDLSTSYPVLTRRELGNAFASMLRYEEWFDVTTNRESELDHDGKVWLKEATETQRRAMEDRDAMFERATKEGDHDFATFGQCAISVDWDPKGQHLSYQCWHLRDMAWSENSSGKIDFIAQKWRPFASDLQDKFKGKTSNSVNEAARKDGYVEIDCMRIICSTRHLDDPELKKWPYVSIYIEVKDCHILEYVGSRTPKFAIPRWETVSGSQYAYSPATIIALPDARLMQAMTATLLRAGEKFVDPPMLARAEAIRSDMALYPGGVTWADAEYDERLGPVMREAYSPKGNGLPWGKEMSDSQVMLLREAFFLNKLTMPFPEREITAYEAGKRVSEYIRQALPLFRPMEIEYNGALCELTFETLLYADGPFGGAFGPISEMPEQLRSQEIKFKFRTPLREAADQRKVFQLRQAKEMLVTMADMDKTVLNIVDANTAVRDALAGNRTPEVWLRSEDDAEAMAQQQREAEATAASLAELQQGAAIAKDVGQANVSFKDAA